MNACSLEHSGRFQTGLGAVPFEVGEQFGHGAQNDSRINAAFATAFMLLPSRAFAPHRCGAMDAAEKIRSWLTDTLASTGKSPRSWALEAGLAASTVQKAIKPDYQFVTSSRTLAKLAEAAGVQPPDLTDPRRQQIVPRYLPVRYKVQAGLWYEVDAEEPPVQVSHAVAPDPRYANWPQWLELVVGDSVNTKILPGHFAHVVDAVDMGYAPRDGDWVVVERRRGGTRERTIKQVEVRGDGQICLWPRSTNPKWSEPVDLCEGVRDGEEIEAEIVGLVIGSYNPF